jgi:hypothetical protein
VAPINVGGLIRVNFHITDDAMSNPVFKIFVVIDSDVFEIAVVAENSSSESATPFGRLSSYSFSVGRHALSFYVVNEIGFVSARAHLQISLIPEVTSILARSPALMQSWIQLQSAALWPSASSSATSSRIGIS